MFAIWSDLRSFQNGNNHKEGGIPFFLNVRLTQGKDFDMLYTGERGLNGMVDLGRGDRGDGHAGD